MNVTDQWMLERMQEMAASMAVPQIGQNTDTPKAEQSESFQDLMNRAKDSRPDAVRKDDGARKAESAQKEEPAQAAQTTRTAQPARTVQTTPKTVQIDPMTGLPQIDVTPEEAALLVAGYAQLSPPMADGTVWMVTVLDENGNPIPPMAAQEELDLPLMNDMPVLPEGEWVMDEITPEFAQALEQLLQRTNDPRPAAELIDGLKQKMSAPQLEPELELTVRTAGNEEKKFDLDAQVMTAAGRPLFRDVEAAPVKVGENFQLDTRDDDMDANLADTIRFAAQQGLQQIEIKLSPENLGQLTVKLTQAADGTLQVVLHASNLKAANLLSQHLNGLNAALQGHGQSGEVRLEVQRNEDSQQSQQEQQRQTDPNGHNRQQQQQQRRQESEHSDDFVQRLRLGLFGPEETH